MFDTVDLKCYKANNLITPLNAHGIEMAEDILKTIKANDFNFTGEIKSFFVPQRGLINNAFNYMYGFHVFKCEPGSFINMAMSNSYIFIYIISGECFVSYDGKTECIKAANGIFLNANTTFSLQFNKPCSLYTFAFNGAVIPYIYGEYYKDKDARASESINGKLHIYINELLNIYSSSHEYRDLKASHMIETIAIYLLSIKLSERLIDNALPQPIKSAMRYIEDNYASNITLDKISEHVILDKYHFAKMFKKYVGVSPKKYLINIRVEQAKFLLTTTDMPASKIALQVGFNDINNFYNLFKKATGLTPIKYRESN